MVVDMWKRKGKHEEELGARKENCNSLYKGGAGIWKNHIRSNFDADWVRKSISEGFKVVGQKLGKILVNLYFVGTFFFLFCFWLIEAMCIFFEKILGDFWTNYHVILPYIDAFNT